MVAISWLSKFVSLFSVSLTTTSGRDVERLQPSISTTTDSAMPTHHQPTTALPTTTMTSRQVELTSTRRRLIPITTTTTTTSEPDFKAENRPPRVENPIGRITVTKNTTIINRLFFLVFLINKQFALWVQSVCCTPFNRLFERIESVAPSRLPASCNGNGQNVNNYGGEIMSKRQDSPPIGGAMRNVTSVNPQRLSSIVLAIYSFFCHVGLERDNNTKSAICIMHSTFAFLNRLVNQAEQILVEEQVGFRPQRSTAEQIFNFRLLVEKHLEHQKEL